MLFYIKNRPAPIKEDAKIEKQGELTYNNEVLGNLVNKDADADGVPDWEEGLWGTDPTRKETTPGIPDGSAIEKLKSKAEQNDQTDIANPEPENLTATDQFSRDLFATIAAATQDGQQIDQATVDKISSSLADHIQNSPPRKVYSPADIKVKNDNSKNAISNYNTALGLLYDGFKGTNEITDILREFVADSNDPNISALSKFDPILKRINGIISGMLKISVPELLARPHLDLINALERIEENVNDIKLYDSDAIVAFSGINQYYDNNATLSSALHNLQNIINGYIKN